MTRRIEFFFPYREVSGVPVLFSRMAKVLAGRGVPVRVLDFVDGAMTRLVTNAPGVEVGIVEEGGRIAVDPDSLLVMQGILPATIRPELAPHAETRLLFWSLHPMNWIPTIVPLPAARDYQARKPELNRWVLGTFEGGLRRRLGDFLSDLDRHGSLLFMDGPNLTSVTDRLGVRFPDPTFLPVPSEPSPQPIHVPDWNGERPLRVGWVGRIADFKVHVLRHTLAQVARWTEATGARAVFDVVGDGPEAEGLRADAPRVDGLEIRWLGSRTPDELAGWLEKDIDLLAAMGTSALEGAGIGVPTLLVDPAYGPVSPRYGYRWLHEAKDFSLGDFVDGSGMGPGRRTFGEVAEELRVSGVQVSRTAYRYVVEHHALDRVVDRFIELAPRAEYRWGALPDTLRRKSVVRRVYERVRALR